MSLWQLFLRSVVVLAEALQASAVRRLRRRLPEAVALHLLGNDAAAAGGTLERLLGSAAVVYLPHAPGETAGDFATLLTAAYAAEQAQVRVELGNLRAVNLLDYSGWDHRHYARGVAYAMTRALTLGRGAAAVAIRAPADGARLEPPPGSDTVDVRFDLDVDAFAVGRDGSWCLVSSVFGQLTCVLQRHLTLVLRVTPPEDCDLDLDFSVALKSNVYGDVIVRSDPVRVALPRRRALDGDPAPPPAYARTEILVWPYRPVCPALAPDDEAP